MGFDALKNNCMVKLPQPADADVSASGPVESGAAIINLDEFLSGFSAVAFVENKLWQSLPAVQALIADYSTATSMLASMMRFVFMKQPAFSQVSAGKDKVLPETMQDWTEKARKHAKTWVSEPALLEAIEHWLVKPLQAELQLLYSAGLSSVAPIVDPHVQGALACGLTRGVHDDVLLKVPQQHPLRGLVESFLQAQSCIAALPGSLPGLASVSLVCCKPPRLFVRIGLCCTLLRSG